MDLDLAGAIHLKGLQWSAVHRTGAKPDAKGTFSIASGSIGEVPLPISDLDSVSDAINTALAESGISVSFPVVDHITKPNDVIIVSPLIIQIKDSPAGHSVFGPILGASREQRVQLFNTIASRYCQATGALLVGEIAMQIVAGTGFLSVQLGGATATSADLDLFNPFGSNDPLAVVPDVLAAVTSIPGTLPTLTSTGIVPPTLSAPPAALTPVRSVCESVSHSKRVGCSRGAAVPVGIIGVLLTAAVGFFDWRRRRAAAAAA
jgi:hypothetical protein